MRRQHVLMEERQATLKLTAFRDLHTVVLALQGRGVLGQGCHTAHSCIHILNLATPEFDIKPAGYDYSFHFGRAITCGFLGSELQTINFLLRRPTERNQTSQHLNISAQPLVELRLTLAQAED